MDVIFAFTVLFMLPLNWAFNTNMKVQMIATRVRISHCWTKTDIGQQGHYSHAVVESITLSINVTNESSH